MAQRTSQPPPLLAYFATKYFPHAVEKGWFRKQRVRLGPLFEVELYLYVTGAVLGRALRDRLDVLARMFSEPGKEKTIVKLLLEQAKRRMGLYWRKQDQTFLEFFINTKWPALSFEENLAALPDSAKTIVPATEAFENLQATLGEAIGFGARYPDVTETLYRGTYENVDPAAWRKFHDAGLNIPEQPDKLPLQEFEEAVLMEVAAFTSEYYPELLEPLGLSLRRAQGCRGRSE